MAEPDLPPEPGEVPDLDHGIPGPPDDLPDDDAEQDLPEDHDGHNYPDEDDEDELDGQVDADPVDDGLDEPMDDSEDD